MILGRYMRWLHTGWPAGTVEKLPEVGHEGVTAVPGVRVVGDLTGIPLLKFSADTGARAVHALLKEEDFLKRRGQSGEVLDLAIVGAGVSGISAAMEAKKAGLRFEVFEAAQEFNTIQNFPKAKPIYTYPTEMKPSGEMQFTTDIKEALLEELEAQRGRAGITVTAARIERVERKGSELLVHHGDKKVTRALRVIVAIGRTGNYRRLGCPGEHLDKVYQRLYDPKDYSGKQALVVGGGDSALETAIALAMVSAHVTVSYRNAEFARPKPENVEKIRALQANPDADVSIEEPSSERVNTAMGSNMVAHGAHGAHGSIRLMMSSRVKEIGPDAVVLSDASGKTVTLPNDVVFAMIGREAPLDFFRRSGIPIRGEWRIQTWVSFVLFFAFCVFLYNWKSGGALNQAFVRNRWFPYNVPDWLAAAGGSIAAAAADPRALLGTLAITLKEPGFYYSLAYCLAVVIFGARRIRRRRTPYVTWQTATLMAVQTVPLFLLPYVALPWAGHQGWFDAGWGKTFADNLFPAANYGHGREYWRAFGLILAWPLFIWNFFTPRPMAWWLVIGGVQTFVIIPLLIRRWGKGVYCGWICSCGALSETLGDQQRQKMPHGPVWNRVNMLGQGVLAFALALLIARVVSWSAPASALGRPLARFYDTLLSNNTVLGVSLDYYHLVDIFLAGIVGVGMYFWFSGRVWCRFACPLAALMHIYARLSRFRIFADKKKCISCNVCTSVCHQGIDIMSFANKGLPMQDPECVRCSACVQSCPTGTLTFGRLGPGGSAIFDSLAASPVLMAESAERQKRRLPLVA